MPSAGLMEMPPLSNVTPFPTSPRTGPGGRPGRIVTKHQQARRLAAAARHTQEQAHPQLRDAILVEDLDLDAAVGCQRCGTPREFPGRERVARLVRELASQIAALGEQAAPVDRCPRTAHDVRRLLGHDDGPRGGSRRRGVPRLVHAGVELRQRQPFGDRLGDLDDIAGAAQHEAGPFRPTVLNRDPASSGQLPRQLAPVLGRRSRRRRAAAGAPARSGP